MVVYLKETWAICKGLDQELELFVRHVHILEFLRDHQPLGILKIAEAMGFPPHKVRYSLRVLEKEGLIVPTSGGAMLTPEAHKFLKDLPGIIQGYKDALESLKTRMQG